MTKERRAANYKTLLLAAAFEHVGRLNSKYPQGLLHIAITPGIVIKQLEDTKLSLELSINFEICAALELARSFICRYFDVFCQVRRASSDVAIDVRVAG